jgi:hypothetical protein
LFADATLPPRLFFVQFCSNQGSTAVNTTIYTLHFESIPQFDHLYETWNYPSPPPVLSQMLAVNLFKAKFQKLFDYTLQDGKRGGGGSDKTHGRGCCGSQRLFLDRQQPFLGFSEKLKFA